MTDYLNTLYAECVHLQKRKLSNIDYKTPTKNSIKTFFIHFEYKKAQNFYSLNSLSNQ